MVRASPRQGEGRRFESDRSYQVSKTCSASHRNAVGNVLAHSVGLAVWNTQLSKTCIARRSNARDRPNVCLSETKA